MIPSSMFHNKTIDNNLFRSEKGEQILAKENLNTQLSNQNEILSPIPTFHLSPYIKIRHNFIPSKPLYKTQTQFHKITSLPRNI